MPILFYNFNKCDLALEGTLANKLLRIRRNAYHIKNLLTFMYIPVCFQKRKKDHYVIVGMVGTNQGKGRWVSIKLESFNTELLLKML